MPYVSRDTNGQINAVSVEPSNEAQENLPPDHPDLRRFLSDTGGSADIQNALLASDLELIRVIEDLIAVLIDKRVIMLTDMPKAAQQKLAKRYELRSQLDDLGGIVPEQEDIALP